LKFVLILATGSFGLFGFTVVIVFVLAQLVSLNTFGVPYMAPLAPFNLRDFMKSIVYSRSTAPRRAAFLRTKDNTRGPAGKRPLKGATASYPIADRTPVRPFCTCTSMCWAAHTCRTKWAALPAETVPPGRGTGTTAF
jgi:hypothetical protein